QHVSADNELLLGSVRLAGVHVGPQIGVACGACAHSGARSTSICIHRYHLARRVVRDHLAAGCSHYLRCRKLPSDGACACAGGGDCAVCVWCFVTPECTGRSTNPYCLHCVANQIELEAHGDYVRANHGFILSACPTRLLRCAGCGTSASIAIDYDL